MNTKKLIIIGLDGATWKVLKPLVDLGQLPNIKKMMDVGIYGELESTFPPVTGPAWLSMATGKNPGKTGVFDFISKEKNGFSGKLVNSADFRKNQSYWDLLNQHGYRTYLINHPMLYPFYNVDGVMVGGMGLPDHANKTYPSSLEDKLNYLTDGYWINTRHTPENKDKFVKDLFKLIEKQFKAVDYLLNQDWNLFLHVSSASDWLQHAMWEDWINTRSKHHQDFLDVWKLLDKKIGLVLQKVANINVLIVSDHGFGSIKENFLLSKWLYKREYINKKRFATIIGAIYSILNFIYLKIKNTRVGNYLKLEKFASRTLKKQFNIGIQIPPEIDIKKSKIIPGPSTGLQGFLYIKKSLINKDKLKQELMNELKKTGKKYGFDIQIYEATDIYSGDKIHLAPDIIFKINNFLCNIQTSTLKGKIFSNVLPMKNHSGDHRTEGIFIAYGPDIKQAGKMEGFKIYDIAPTILHMFNIPIPKNVDGKVLKEIFREDSEFAKRDVRYNDYNNEKEKLKAKIQNLKLSGKI